MENLIEYIPTILTAGGLYIGYKIITKVKRAAMKIAAIALGLTAISKSDINTNNLLESTSTFLTENTLIEDSTDAILATYETFFNEKETQEETL
jgi:hypothetical protein